MNELICVPEVFPPVAVDSIRRSYLHLRKKGAEETAIRKALDRLVQGETGKSMTPEDAIAFLRSRVFEARQAFAGREKMYVPHLTTYLNQRRYLMVAQLPPPENLEEAVSILGCYPTITAVDVDAHMGILRMIASHIDYLKPTHGSAAASYIRTRTFRYAECVAKWDKGDWQFIPGALKFFQERRYEQPEHAWHRTAKSGFESERDQLHRIT